MKIRFLTGSLFLISILNMKAQEKLSVYVDLKSQPTDKIDFNETNIGVSFNAAIHSKIKIRNSIEYSNLKVNYDLGSFTAFENPDSFKQIKNTFEITHEISDTKLNLSLMPSVNFQEKPDFTDLTVLGSFVITQHLNLKTDVAVGVSRTTAFGHPKFLPSVSMQYKINEKSTVMLGFPNSKISYANNTRNAFSLTNSFNGNFYHLDHSPASNAKKISQSQMTTALEYERNVDQNWFVSLKAGYDFNKKYNILDKDNHTVHDFNTGNGHLLSIGIKYKH